MTLRAARFASSPRLQQVHALLLRGPRTTREILEGAPLCAAVSAAIAELRWNGAEIDSRFLRGAPGGARVCLYTLVRPVPKGKA